MSSAFRILFCTQLLYIFGDSVPQHSTLQQHISNREKYEINLEPKREPTVEVPYLNAIKFEAKAGILTPESNYTVFRIPKTFKEYVQDVDSLIKSAKDTDVQKLARAMMQPKHVTRTANPNTEEAIKVLRNMWKAIKIGDMHLHMNATMPMQIMINYLKELYLGKKDAAGNKYMDIVHTITVTEDTNASGERLGTKTTKKYTLSEVFAECGIKSEADITEEALQMTAPENSKISFKEFHGFAVPFRNPLSKQTFFLIDGPTKGIHLANLIHLTLEASPNELKEINMGLFGKEGELQDWVNWVKNNKFLKQKNLKFKFQLPRFLGLSGQPNYNKYLENVFLPILKASSPNAGQDEKDLMSMIVGFDSVGEELGGDEPMDATFNPETYTTMNISPDYLVHIYYIWANIRVINKFRSLQNLSVFSFTPHCGEAGSYNHFAGAFLLANYIGHGIELRHDSNVVYKLLYTLMRIGSTICPISNARLYLDLPDSPTKALLHDGIIATLGTDDPTIFHGQKLHPLDPLLAEYETIARQLNLSLEDIILMLKNGSLLSGFRDDIENSLEHPSEKYIAGDTPEQDMEVWKNAKKAVETLKNKRTCQIKNILAGIGSAN